MKKSTDYGYPEYMFDRNEYDILKNFWENRKVDYEKKQMVVFGAGIRGSIFGKWLKSFGAENIIFSDNNSQKWGGTIDGIPIESPEKIREQIQNKIIVISIESKRVVEEVERQLVEYGYSIGENIFSFPSKVYDNYIEKFKKTQSDHVLILGDCRFTFVSYKDVNTATLDDMLEEKFEDGKIDAKVLSMHALCMKAQYYVIKTQIEMGLKPQKVVLPINIETYNETMPLLSSSQHYELLDKIYQLSISKEKDFEDYVEQTKQRTINPPFIFSLEEGAGTELMSDKKLRIFLKMSYMYAPSEDNEGTVYLRKFLELAKREDIEVYAFVPPLNYVSGKEYWGDRFIDDYNKIVSFYETILKEYDAKFLDQSYILTESEFYSKYDKNEIANYEGRKIMADSIFEFIKKD